MAKSPPPPAPPHPPNSSYPPTQSLHTPSAAPPPPPLRLSVSHNGSALVGSGCLQITAGFVQLRPKRIHTAALTAERLSGVIYLSIPIIYRHLHHAPHGMIQFYPARKKPKTFCLIYSIFFYLFFLALVPCWRKGEKGKADTKEGQFNPAPISRPSLPLSILQNANAPHMRLVFPARQNTYGLEEMREADTTPATQPPPRRSSRSFHSDRLFINIQLLAGRCGRGPGGPQRGAQQPGLSLFNAPPD